MPQLHELTASVETIKDSADKARTELQARFAKQPHHFEETLSTFTPDDETQKARTETHSKLTTTVRAELDRFAVALAKAIDVAAQIAEGDTRARGTITIDGTPLVEDLPSIAIVQLERRIGQIKGLIEAAPTLDPALGFKLDGDKGKHVYKAREVEKTRTQKQPKVIEKTKATPEHAATADIISIDVPIGTLLEQRWSGMLTPADKAAMIERCDLLIAAGKEALARANRVDVKTDLKIGRTLLTYIIGAPPTEG